jgi:hypothetical protein
MSLSRFLKSISWLTGTLVISSILLPDSASAFSTNFTNQGFESSYSNWSQTGDTSIQGTFQTTAPIQGNSQALITTGHHTRIDDNATPASTFNYSGTNPVTSTTDPNAANLQNFLGLSTNGLSIHRQSSADDSTFRTAKEGSGIYQDFSFTVSAADVTSGKNKLQLIFNEAFLTNDGKTSLLGNQDFAFFTLFDNNSSSDSRSINVLDNSAGTATSPLGSGVTNFQNKNTAFYSANNQRTYLSSSLAAGTYNYRLGFGVVDVDGIDRSSGLLLDNIRVRQVPFEFSPGLGLCICGSIFGFSRLRKKLKGAISDRNNKLFII